MYVFILSYVFSDLRHWSLGVQVNVRCNAQNIGNRVKNIQ